MKRGFEASDLSENSIEARPGELLCACCMHGGALCTAEEPERIRGLLQRIRQDSNVHIVLKTAFDDAGARTELYEKTTPAQRKRDLDILRELGEIPEAVRTAQVWYEMLKAYIPNPVQICAPHEQETAEWQNCPNANADHYQTGLATICHTRDKCEKACVKASSCRMIAQADTLSVRAHHFMCMTCFLGGTRPDEPLEEDNLYELWQKILEKPDIPIKVIEGPGECVVCPPCYAFNPESRLCFVSCSLRDRKKDLDVFSKISVLPGEVLPAREILLRIYRNIKQVDGICRFEERRGFEWKSCRPVTDVSFIKGMQTVAKALDFSE